MADFFKRKKETSDSESLKSKKKKNKKANDLNAENLDSNIDSKVDDNFSKKEYKKKLKNKNKEKNNLLSNAQDAERLKIISKHAKADKSLTKEEAQEQQKRKKEFKQKARQLAKATNINSKAILAGQIVSTANYKPDVENNIIELCNVKKSYLTGDLEYEVLKGIELKIKPGSFVIILGPSGSGKTTLLNIISGLDKANSGDVFVAGHNLTLLKDSHLTKFRRDNVGFIFQQYNLLTNLTARENAEVGENLAKTKNKELGIDEIFKVIEMDEHMNKFPSQLSGGQQQRVSIGRALAKNPKILFCDEPTGALDEEMGRKVLEILIDVNRAYKTTIIMVTHNSQFQYVANTVIKVNNGKISSVWNNEKPLKPSEINWS